MCTMQRASSLTHSYEPRFRLAGPADAAAVARLHAESWRRHYRGAYADAFLDGDVEADRRNEWSRRLQEPDRRPTVGCTVARRAVRARCPMGRSNALC